MTEDAAKTGQEGVKLTFNQDGSVDLPIEGKLIRFTKESDLLAIKVGKERLERDWETEKAQFNTQLAEANRIQNETRQELLQAQAAKELLAEQSKDYDTHKNRVGELEKELGSHRERLAGHEKELAKRMCQSLIAAGAIEESLKGKTLDQLRDLENAASIFGRELKPRPANYDGGKPGGATAPETPLDRAKRILAEHEEKGHRIGSKQVKVG